MQLLYNLLLLLGLVLLLPPAAVVVALTPKHRQRVLPRVGVGLPAALRHFGARKPVFWIHALSVGEVTSALPLVVGITRRWPQAALVFSVTTQTGLQVARTLFEGKATVISSPIDLPPVLDRFIAAIRPDLFLLVETDIWPNWLWRLKRKGVPTMLVNGRISADSLARYQRFSFFFTPVFQSFSLLSMQTEADAEAMRRLGVAQDRTRNLGNLKFDTAQALQASQSLPELSPASLGFSPDTPIWVCGSTHAGEEEVLLAVFADLERQGLDLQLLLAPRSPDRAEELQAMGNRLGLPLRRRTDRSLQQGPVLILDTIGELARCYRFATVAFIGGSLVPFGGHNPLEAAAFGIPILFGPHMEDFAEISADLLSFGGALLVTDMESTKDQLRRLLTDRSLHARTGAAALARVKVQAGVIERHLDCVAALLSSSDRASCALPADG